MSKVLYKPVTYHGIEYYPYFVDASGDIYNAETGNHLTPTSDTTCKYPRVSMKDSNGKYKRYLMHRIVAEAFVPLTLPKNSDINEEEWEMTPQSVKKFIMKSMLVNHIDHDKENYDHKNLEWVTSEENAAARNKFYGI